MLPVLDPLASELEVELAHGGILFGRPWTVLDVWTEVVQISLTTLFASARVHFSTDGRPKINVANGCRRSIILRHDVSIMVPLAHK